MQVRAAGGSTCFCSMAVFRVSGEHSTLDRAMGYHELRGNLPFRAPSLGRARARSGCAGGKALNGLMWRERARSRMPHACRRRGTKDGVGGLSAPWGLLYRGYGDDQHRDGKGLVRWAQGQCALTGAGRKRRKRRGAAQVPGSSVCCGAGCQLREGGPSRVWGPRRAAGGASELRPGRGRPAQRLS
jgi:hypothetical protein